MLEGLHDGFQEVYLGIVEFYYVVRNFFEGFPEELFVVLLCEVSMHYLLVDSTGVYSYVLSDGIGGLHGY